MIVVRLAPLVAGYGTWLLYSAVALGWSGVRPVPRRRAPHRPRRDRFRGALRRVGISARPAEVVAAVSAAAVLAATGAWVLFGGLLASASAAVVAVAGPVGALRDRSRQARADALEAWPQLIHEVRILVGAAGRSLPQALFDVGSRAPDAMRPAFADAHRVWSMSTDFDRAVHVLAAGLADAATDAVCEVLRVAHQTSGTDIDARLAALAEDRATEVRHRRDARARQAGVRFARRFVLAVPLGMALCGLAIGDGRRAYATATGQALVAAGLAAVAACWAWAGRLLRLPAVPRTTGDGT